MMRHLIATAATGALLFASSPVAAQEALVRQLLDRAGSIIAERGFTPSHKAVTGTLAQGATYEATVPLDAGTEYAIQAVCDNDCSDLDLVLLDASGAELGRDVEDDDNPVISTMPLSGGNYRVRVMMAACSSEPCAFGLGIYGH